MMRLFFVYKYECFAISTWLLKPSDMIKTWEKNSHLMTCRRNSYLKFSKRIAAERKHIITEMEVLVALKTPLFARIYSPKVFKSSAPYNSKSNIIYKSTNIWLISRFNWRNWINTIKNLYTQGINVWVVG